MFFVRVCARASFPCSRTTRTRMPSGLEIFLLLLLVLVLRARSLHLVFVLPFPPLFSCCCCCGCYRSVVLLLLLLILSTFLLARSFSHLSVHRSLSPSLPPSLPSSYQPRLLAALVDLPLWLVAAASLSLLTCLFKIKKTPSLPPSVPSLLPLKQIQPSIGIPKGRLIPFK